MRDYEGVPDAPASQAEMPESKRVTGAPPGSDSDGRRGAPKGDKKTRPRRKAKRARGGGGSGGKTTSAAQAPSELGRQAPSPESPDETGATPARAAGTDSSADGSEERRFGAMLIDDATEVAPSSSGSEPPPSHTTASHASARRAGVSEADASDATAPESPASASPDPASRAGRSRRRRGRRGAGGAKDASAAAKDTAPAAHSGAASAEPEASETCRSRAAKGIEKRVLIDALDPEELRIVVLESGLLQELHLERRADKKVIGNIYKGRVVNLEPGIQAAFVEIGIGRNGFLHVSDILPAYANATAIPIDSLSTRPTERRRSLIQNVLQKGQEVLVQISKDSIGAKGPSLTTYVSIPGKYLVLMPGVSRFGVSKRIQDGGERAKLRASLSSLDPPKGLGYIVRTAGKEKSGEVLARDLQSLVSVWEQVRGAVGSRPAPSLVYEESDLLTRALRDICGPDVDEIVVNDEATLARVQAFLEESMPSWDGAARHYGGTVPLFARYGVEEEIEKTYNRRVPLPSGGHLVIEQTEALVAIDVNSGRFTDEEDLEDTAYKTNLEAAAEIARQLRLRDLGGVIVNDFIDMVVEKNRREVEAAFKAALRRDRAKCWLSKISRFGIIEMTRQRVRQSLERSLFEPCEHCRGMGVVKAPRVTAASILRQLRAGMAARRKDVAEVVAHPAVQSYLLNERRSDICGLEDTFRKTIVVLADPHSPRDKFTIRYR